MRIPRAAWCGVVALLATQGGLADELFTNVYVVPPNFLTVNHPPGPDPFADPADFRDGIVERPTAKGVLEGVGVTFPAGASAIYNPETSQLIIRNTEDQLELVEAFIDSLSGVERQIFLTIREAVYDVEARGGPFQFLLEAPAPIEPGEPARTIRDKESFLDELSRPPAEPAEADDLPPSRIAGVFTDPQYQVILRALEQSEDVEILEAPSVMARSGQPALVQVGERRYGVIPVIGGDEFTVELNLYLPRHGEALFEEGEERKPTQSLTIWDGQAVAVSEINDDREDRVVFVRAQLMDPAGLPIHPGGEEADHEEDAERLEVEWNEDREEPDPVLLDLLKDTILPKVDFRDTALVDALEFLHDQLPPPGDEDDGRNWMVFQAPEEVADSPITLRLANVPLLEALRYTSELGRCRFRIVGRRIEISPVE